MDFVGVCRSFLPFFTKAVPSDFRRRHSSYSHRRAIGVIYSQSARTLLSDLVRESVITWWGRASRRRSLEGPSDQVISLRIDINFAQRVSGDASIFLLSGNPTEYLFFFYSHSFHIHSSVYISHHDVVFFF